MHDCNRKNLRIEHSTKPRSAIELLKSTVESKKRMESNVKGGGIVSFRLLCCLLYHVALFNRRLSNPPLQKKGLLIVSAQYGALKTARSITAADAQRYNAGMCSGGWIAGKRKRGKRRERDRQTDRETERDRERDRERDQRR